MNRHSFGKLVIFFLGILLGAGLFWLYGEYVNSNIFNNSTYVIDHIIEAPVENMDVDVKKKKKKKSTLQNESNVSDSLAKAIPDSLLDVNLSFEKINTDTVFSQSSDSNFNSDLVVMQDEKVYARFYKPTGNPVVFHCDYDSKMDSLLIDNTMNLSKEGLLVEFWRSPVNFKGYRLSRQKLILFGIFEYDSLSFHYHEEEVLIMKYKRNNYTLRCGNEFIPIILNPNRKGRKPS